MRLPVTGSTPTLSLRHVAIIMDGNRRWAQKKRLPVSAGHLAGVESVRRVIRLAIESQISALTIFAFSSENWKRPPQEIQYLLQLFERSLDQELSRLHRRSVRLRFIGALSEFPECVQGLCHKAEALTRTNTGLLLTVALNYGGQWDIAQAAQQCAAAVLSHACSIEDITPEYFAQYLSAGLDFPPVDLLIRTSGEYRLSNFLLWHLAYSELFFTPVLWPDFGKKTWLEALDCFASRQRRYGGGAGTVRNAPARVRSPLAARSAEPGLETALCDNTVPQGPLPPRVWGE